MPPLPHLRTPGTCAAWARTISLTFAPLPKAWSPCSAPGMACLETIVHLGASKSLPLNLYMVRIDVPTDVWAQVTMIDIASHIGWDALPVGMVSINWGTKWCANMTSALALVPSVVVPEEFNVLLNPVHGDAAKLKATKIRKWLYDPRAVGQ